MITSNDPAGGQELARYPFHTPAEMDSAPARPVDYRPMDQERIEE
jgi:hypothetical protein